MATNEGTLESPADVVVVPGESTLENPLNVEVPGTLEHPISFQSKKPYHSRGTGGTAAVSTRLDVTKAKDYQKSIILLGKTGVGKKTLARHIFEDHAKSFPEGGSVNSVTRQPILYEQHNVDMRGNQDEKIKVQLIIIDTNGLGGPSYRMSDVLGVLKDLQNVSLIFFLLKHGRVTSEDCKPFTDIIKNLDENCGNICHLVVTGCEGQGEASRESIKQLYISDPMTQKLCSFVEEKIIPVGFPDLTTLIPMMRDLYKDGIMNDKKTLQDIVTKSEYLTFDMAQAVKTSTIPCLIL